MTQLSTVDYIVTAQHYDRARGGEGSMKGWIMKCRDDILRDRHIFVNIMALHEVVDDRKVKARIWQGQWIADCPDCGGAMFVDPEDPIFFCFGCGNRRTESRARSVVFPSPEDRATIEKLLLDRPVDDSAGLNDLERVTGSRPLIVHEEKGGLSRNWNPDETIDDLREQNKLVERWRKDLKKMVR